MAQQLILDRCFGFAHPPSQFLKWIGNKQRFATQITSFFPSDFETYIEPFVGSGAILGAIRPNRGIAGDALLPLIELWKLLQEDPQQILSYYGSVLQEYEKDDLVTYKRVLAEYNETPNPLSLLFICRSCYGGVVRFTKAGKISTPMGPHKPIGVESLRNRINQWRQCVRNTTFRYADFEETMGMAREGDLIYCDPPYAASQKILYGAQDFTLERLWQAIDDCKRRGARVALSIDGIRKSGKQPFHLEVPPDLFEREVMVEVGKCMLRRFQKQGETMDGEDVRDRLLLTW